MSGCPGLGWVGRKWGVTVERLQISFYGDESSLKSIVVVVAQIYKCTKNIELYIWTG